MERICKKCGFGQEINLFSKNKNNKDGLQNYCKTCKSNNDKTSNIKNWEKLKVRNKVKNHKKSLIRDDWKINLGGKCKKCNDNRLYVLDFHHLDPKTKEIQIGNAWSYKSIEDTFKEIKKCIPLCSNCHREFHHLEKLNGITIKEYLENKI